MIRLTFVSTLAYNYFFPGQVRQAGGHTRIYNLARAFAKLPEYEVFCVTGDFGQPDLIEKEGVTLVKAPIDNPFALAQVLLTLKRLDSDLLVDFCASPRLFLYLMLKKLTGLNYLFLTGCDNDVNGDYKKTENAVYSGFYEIGLKHADGVVAQVPSHGEVLKKRLNIDSHLVLSPYFEISERPRVEKDTILWVGRAAYYKRPDLFVHLARCFPEQKFVMICNQSPYDRGFMGSVETPASIPSNLEFYDYVPYPEMEGFYSRALFLVNTSDYEGFSNTFIEAAVHRTPVVSLNSDPNQMLSVHGCGGVCHGRFELLQELCSRLLKDRGAVQEAGKKAFDYAFRFHGIDRAVDRFDQLFKLIIMGEQP